MFKRLALVSPLLIATAIGLAACGSSSGGGKQIALVAYSTPKSAYEALVPAFQATAEGKGVSFTQSYGGSGEQSRAVANGQHADVVNFSLEPDVERLVKAGLVSPAWSENSIHGLVTHSALATIIRKRTPKHTSTCPPLTN